MEMEILEKRHCTAFEGPRIVAVGDLADVAVAARQALDQGKTAPVLLFDDQTGEQLLVNLQGDVEEVRRRYEGIPPRSTAEEAPRGPGRPKLGVVAREVTLLPRHWEWLNGQPGGASVALRKLVEEARRANAEKDRTRRAQEAAYRFMSAIGGNLPDFEEATRALFAGNQGRFGELIGGWPDDIQTYLGRLAQECFPSESEAGALAKDG
jgi:hypothetical protein